MTAYTQVSTNRIKTWLIMCFFALFITLVIYVFTKALGFDSPSALGFSAVAMIIAGIMNYFSYYFSDKVVMAISSAKQIKKSDNPTLFRTVENLCIASGLPMPKIYIIDDSAPNAFATGRDPNHSAIAFTSGILEKLNKLELEGVTAHELSHVGNYDTRLMAIVAILVGMVALAADFFIRISFFRGGDRDNDNGSSQIFIILGFILALLSPIIATLIQLSISRKREFLADASGALLTRNPEGLATALIKISKDNEPLEVANKATAHLYIVNPFKEGHGALNTFASLFNTHPPISDRVKALREME